MFNKNLADIYADTKKKCISGQFSKLEKGVSKIYKGIESEIVSQIYEPKYKTVIKVINKMVLDTTQDLIKEGNTNIMVLNLASTYKPGGGVINGAIAQEEDLFRKTNYFLSLSNNFYPIPQTNVIFTDKVFVIKDNNFNDHDEPFAVSMLAAAAIKNPQLVNGRFSQLDYKVMKTTIENIFKVAYLEKKENLVLGALGCGAYHNPPLIIISIFNEFLLKYNGCFKNIVFAVYSKKDDNFELFNTKLFKNE